ncbi:hypothetical protein MRB53_011154 [Persea americana]|uniref:Uncharacterized protein n=1 Tax=Persea americana TaxID=3435 RepID=A0ACC2LUS3_PERAE|nr:hypothetical protein MRB53_011154 [Persea americana]
MSTTGNTGSTLTPILFSFVGAIFVIFLFLSYFNILRRRRFLFHVPPFRDRALMSLLNENNLADETPLHFHSHGLDFAIVRSLPSVQFRKSKREQCQSSTDCAVCLGEFAEGEWLRLLPNCAHIFHVVCVDTWFQTHSTCPLCRSDVLHDFNSQQSCSLSMFTLMETLRREDVHSETSYGDNLPGSEIMQNSVVGYGPTYSGWVVSESEESVSTISSPIVTNDLQNADCQLKQDHCIREGSSSRDAYCHNQHTQL